MDPNNGNSDSVPLPQAPTAADSAALAAPSLTRLPDPATLRSLDPAAQIDVLNLLFEPCPHTHTLALPIIASLTVTSYDDLIEAIRSALLQVQASVHADPEASAPLLAILSAHPRLGEKKVDSAQSRAEQARLHQAGDDGESGARRLAELNAEYEARFPGLRYVVFVNGRGRDMIMQNMRERIDRGDANAEEQEAINAMCDIAKDRARKLLDAPAA